MRPIIKDVNEKIIIGYLKSPIGTIMVSGTDEAVYKIHFMDGDIPNDIEPAGEVKKCIEQLEEYFNGKRKEFSVNTEAEGTAFQQEVWKYLVTIPFGIRKNYMDIAKYMGDVKKIRAVGNANSQNPLAIIVPCHRVIGSDGSLVGYAGGLWRKKWLLEHENAAYARQLELF